MGWVSAGGHEVAPDDDGKVVCRNAAGRRSGSVPPEIAGDPAVVGLRQLAEWPSSGPLPRPRPREAGTPGHRLV